MAVLVTEQRDAVEEELQPAASEGRFVAPNVALVDRYIDEPRHLRVAVIGGGLTGVLAGILLPAKVPEAQLTIFEKNQDFGGTWLENVYPGVRCDIPSHVYQASFSPNARWSDEFAAGAEIRDYWQATARKYDAYRFARFRHRVDSAVWDEAAAEWALAVRDLEADTTAEERFDWVLTAVGRFNAWKLPDIAGIGSFGGLVRHASHWDTAFDPGGKRVAVIGNGASGMQLVTSLWRKVERLDHYARSKTWVATSWAGDERTLEPQPIPEERQAAFADPHTYLRFRKRLEDKYWRNAASFVRGSPESRALRVQLAAAMAQRLVARPKPGLDAEALIPDFAPNCRRLTPAPGYLEALASDEVVYVTAPIRRITATGIEAADGTHRDVDAIFCATGTAGNMLPSFTIRGLDGDTTLADTWAAKDGFPYTYLGLATPGFPNLLFVQGPHGAGPGGSVPHAAETQLVHCAKVLRKAAREGIRTMAPSARAADEFVAYSDAFFSRTVLFDGCSSWYNGGCPGGRIHGLWPGSGAHLSLVRKEPRWEDWEYEHLCANRFSWHWGNGFTRKELDSESDITSYLQACDVDLRDLHERWWSWP